MNWRTIQIIFRKELLETLRDKHTLIAMVGVPLLLYPILILLMTQVMAAQRGKLERAESRVVIVGSEAAQVSQWLAVDDKIKVVESQQWAEDLAQRRIDAVVQTESGLAAALAGTGSSPIKIDYDSTEESSRKAMDRVRDTLEETSKKLLTQRLTEAGLTAEFVEPLVVKNNNIAPPQKRAGSALGMILPMLMIVMIGVGAFYPAMDLTAGEKERGTFETLLSTPTQKTEIVCGKFIAVLTLALATGLLNLLSMGLTIGFQISQVAKASSRADSIGISQLQISAGTVLLMIAVLVPLAFFICGLMMTIAMFAKNIKEANNYIAPFFLVITLPAVFAGMPGVELNPFTACIPITNVALLFKGLLVGNAAVEHIFTVLVSTAAYAMLALVAAVKMFQSEDVILSEEKGIPLSLRRSMFTPRSSPTIGLSLVLFGAMLLMMFYLGSYFQQLDLLSGIFISQWGLLLVPTVAVLWYVKTDMRKSLHLNRFPLLAIPAMLLLWFGTFILVNMYGNWQATWLPAPEGYSEAVGKLFQTQGDLVSTMLVILAVGLSPAVCEEVLFRGAILSGVRSKLRPTAAIILVGILFGLMHMMLHTLVPTAMLGIVITYIAVRSGSIYPAMLFHLINNTVACIAEMHALPLGIQEFVESETTVPTWLILTAIAATIAGVWLMERCKVKTA